MTGSISSLLASSEKYKDKMVLVRARSGETELKFSSRLGDSFPKEVNLGLIMQQAAELGRRSGRGAQHGRGREDPDGEEGRVHAGRRREGLRMMLTLELTMRCASREEAASLEAALSPDNKSVPKDQRFSSGPRAGELLDS